MGKASERRSRPYRSSTRSIPKIKPSDRTKVVYYEYGTEYDNDTGKSSLYVDIVRGNADLVDFVGFRFWPSGETHNVRKRTTVLLSDGAHARRFTVRQSSVEQWSKRITIMVSGKGGSKRIRRLRAKPASQFRERPLKFLETRPLRSNYVSAPNFRFGVEIETSLDGATTADDVVRAIYQHANVTVKDMTDPGRYRRGSEDNYSTWLLVPDSSTVCSRSDPNCNKFELVSRILNGEDGLEECKNVLLALQGVGKIACNKSMGMHVHVDVQQCSLEHLKNVCLNFVKHESAIDTFMPPSRKNSVYCKSNSDAIPCNGNGLKHNAIAACQSFVELCDVVNPGPAQNARYYKLNLQNLHPLRQYLKHSKQPKSTVEFRQHSCTTSFQKVEAWVRFCTSLVQNSVERPRKLKYYEDGFESLFDTVIQDVKLKEFYRLRKMELLDQHQHQQNGTDQDHNHDHACCGGCRNGKACATAVSGRMRNRR